MTTKQRSAATRIMKKFAFWSLIVFLSLAQATALAAGTGAINLPQYLQLVKERNFAAKGSAQDKAGAEGRKSEADLIFSPLLFANGELSSNSTPQDLDMMGAMYDKLETRKYSMGFSQTYQFGLQAKLYYSLQHLHYYFPGQADTVHYNASPVIELTQSLWQNAKGRYDQSKEDSIRAQAETDKWSAENYLRTLLVNAEKAYWNLAVSREIVTIQERAVADAQTILDYDTKRVKMNLMDKSDVLQAKASLESKRLDLQTAKDAAAAALRDFCAYSNMQPSEQIAVAPVDWSALMKLDNINRHGDRADVEMAQAQAAQNSATARMNVETDKPVFNVYLSQTLNGQNPNFSGVVGNSFNINKPATTLGVKFSIPLKYSSQKEARHGAELKEAAAKLTYRQKLLDQESDWRNLAAKLRDARARLEMAFSIEAAQKEKLEYEKSRLKEGRTTTYQILSFEQDFSQAQYNRATLAATVLGLAAQVKLYGELPMPPAAIPAVTQ
ncbi:MAG: TolC family protein [Elusimicrobiaceae bacterium]